MHEWVINIPVEQYNKYACNNEISDVQDINSSQVKSLQDIQLRTVLRTHYIPSKKEDSFNHGAQ